MTPVELIVIGLYAFAVLLPLLPGLFELRVATDDDPLKIDTSYARDPRFLGKSMRAKLGPVMNEVAGEARVPFLHRKNEFAQVSDGFESIDRAQFADVVLSRGRFVVGDRSAMLDVYARGEVTVGASATLRTLASDGTAKFGSNTRVARWIDVEGNCTIGNGSDLGQSASAAGNLIVGSGVRFNRLFGRPVAVLDPRRAELRALTTNPLAARFSYERRLVASCVIDPGSIVDEDIVATKDVFVGTDATIEGSIKAAGTVTIAENACVMGNVIARGTVRLSEDATVLGHIFGDEDVILEPGALVGDRYAPKTLHASRAARLAPEACVYGWVIAERGGVTLS